MKDEDENDGVVNIFLPRTAMAMNIEGNNPLNEFKERNNSFDIEKVQNLITGPDDIEFYQERLQ